MLNNIQILEKLDKLPGKFDADCAAGKWCMAAWDYENALLVSSFVQMDDVARDRLLSRFDQAKVEEAYKAAGWYEEKKDADRERDYKKAV